jgi:hypothetical protein
MLKRRKARGKKRAAVKLLLLVSSCRVRPRPCAVLFLSRLRLPLSSLLENGGKKALSSVIRFVFLLALLKTYADDLVFRRLFYFEIWFKIL